MASYVKALLLVFAHSHKQSGTWKIEGLTFICHLQVVSHGTIAYIGEQLKMILDYHVIIQLWETFRRVSLSGKWALNRIVPLFILVQVENELLPLL